jgi:hypothetical protein
MILGGAEMKLSPGLPGCACNFRRLKLDGLYFEAERAKVGVHGSGVINLEG